MLIPRTQNGVLRQKNTVASSVENIIAETHEKAKELGAITSEVEATKETIRITRAENTRLINESNQAEKKRGEHESASKDARVSVSRIARRSGQILAKVEAKEKEAESLEKQIALYQEEVAGGQKTMEDVRAGLEAAKLTLSGLNTQITELNENLNNLEAEAKEWEAKIAKLKYEESEIMGRIETSIEAFRVFESRIAKFSEETGYLVGYPRVEAPKL